MFRSNHRVLISYGLVTEENAIRAMDAMAEQTMGLEAEELLLPEDYLEEYKDSRPPKEREEDPEEMEVDELTEEETEEEVVESDGGSDYDGGDGNGKKTKGKGKAREKVKKPAKPTSGEKKPKPKKKPKPAGQVLNELVSSSYSRSSFGSPSHRSKKGTP